MGSLIPASWRTTLAGLVTGLIVILTQVSNAVDSDPATVCDWNKIVEGVGLVSIGVLARDRKVTSEEENAK